jgi:UDP-2,3-diacylglucosamine pyrophosphatase LpxH
MSLSLQREPTRFRTIWISDLHLGTKHTRAEDLLDFLRCVDSTFLFLVGDIFDGWALSRNWLWKQSHNDVVQKLLRKSRKGTHVTYIPGNHDEFARDYVGHRFGDILVEQETVHTLLDGSKLLVLHGDEFDGIIRYAKWLQLLGAIAYGFALGLNSVVNRVRQAFDRPYWSLSAYLKKRTKKALQYIDDFEQLVAERARQERVDGVVCGHIHQAEMREIDGIQYLNTGDWVESCTALVEHFDGRLEIIDWSDPQTREKYDLEAPTSEGQHELLVAGDGLPGLIPEIAVPQAASTSTPEVS